MLEKSTHAYLSELWMSFTYIDCTRRRLGCWAEHRFWPRSLQCTLWRIWLLGASASQWVCCQLCLWRKPPSEGFTSSSRPWKWWLVKTWSVRLRRFEWNLAYLKSPGREWVLFDPGIPVACFRYSLWEFQSDLALPLVGHSSLLILWLVLLLFPLEEIIIT